MKNCKVINKETGEEWFLTKESEAGKAGNQAGEKCAILYSLSHYTPYSEESILDFMKLSGLEPSITWRVLIEYSKLGITDLKGVNILQKLGHINYDNI